MSVKTNIYTVLVMWVHYYY